jgi:hypothetical protein
MEPRFGNDGEGVLSKSNIHAKKQFIDRLVRGRVAAYLNAILFNSF